MSLLQKQRQLYSPPIPTQLQNLSEIGFVQEKANYPAAHLEELKKRFPLTILQPLALAQRQQEKKRAAPLRIGVVFSGGQAPGGHNVISGLFDAIKQLHPESTLYGFLGGPSGIISGIYQEITSDKLKDYRNQGGFDLIGSGRAKIETEEQLQASLKSVAQLDGLVIIGGDDSNTNAALLAEYFLSQNCSTKVIGVPKTIDGDLKNAYVSVPFGFDTACRVYSDTMGNIARDALSAKKYTHFIKLMGRSASHITLECALNTRPNLALIGEEISAEKKTLNQVIQGIADLICRRSEKKKEYGVILIPEGLIEFISEAGQLIKELNQVPDIQLCDVEKKVTASSSHCFSSLPELIQKQLLLERDPHGNIQLSLIETERLIIEQVSLELKKRKKEGSFQGKFSPQAHFLGYEGRAAFPSNFDCNYTYVLGMTAALLVSRGLTGYMAFVANLTKPTSEWTVGGVPLTSLLTLEMRKGALKPVIQKALVDLKGKAFTAFRAQREKWSLEDAYNYPGPIQFYGDKELSDSRPMTL